MTIQLDDVVKMCCDSDNVLCIDTAFNLCSIWVTDCCYDKDRLRTNEGKTPMFLDLAVAHFEMTCFCLAVSLLEC